MHTIQILLLIGIITPSLAASKDRNDGVRRLPTNRELEKVKYDHHTTEFPEAKRYHLFEVFRKVRLQAIPPSKEMIIIVIIGGILSVLCFALIVYQMHLEQKRSREVLRECDRMTHVKIPEQEVWPVVTPYVQEVLDIEYEDGFTVKKSYFDKKANKSSKHVRFA